MVDVVPEKLSAPAEKVLWAYQTDVCACDSTACIVELADRHTALLMSLRDFDPGNTEQRALIEGIKKGIELVRAREQPVDFKTPAPDAAPPLTSMQVRRNVTSLRLMCAHLTR